jgi:hypothetical protein
LQDRLNERNQLQDARVSIVMSSMTEKEIAQIKHMSDIPQNSALCFNLRGNQALFDIVILTRLLDKQLIVFIGETKDKKPQYVLSPFGKIVANYLMKKDNNTLQRINR